MPENLAKPNFKSTMSQLAELNFLELRFSSNMQTNANHRSEMIKNKQDKQET